MNRRVSGRLGVRLLFGAAVVCVAVLLAVLLFGKTSASEGAAQFMSALARRDAARIAELSILGEDPPAEIESKWKRTFELARFYRFSWKLGPMRTVGEDAQVTVMVERNNDSGSSYPEQYALEMTRAGKGWKVDVASISRDMFPYLPRPADPRASGSSGAAGGGNAPPE